MRERGNGRCRIKGGRFEYSILPTQTGDTDTCKEDQKVLEIEAKAEEGDED